MAWVDYEMWPTLRTERWRQGANIYRDRVYRAIGGLQTCILSAGVGYGCAKYYHCLWFVPYNIPTWGKMASLGLVGVFAGKYLGILLWGDMQEYRNLKRNKSIYKKELDNYKKAFYW